MAWHVAGVVCCQCKTCGTGAGSDPLIPFLLVLHVSRTTKSYGPEPTCTVHRSRMMPLIVYRLSNSAAGIVCSEHNKRKSTCLVRVCVCVCVCNPNFNGICVGHQYEEFQQGVQGALWSLAQTKTLQFACDIMGRRPHDVPARPPKTYP